MVIDASNVLPGMAVVGQVVTIRVEAVFVSNPGDFVDDSLPLVRVGAAPHVVTRFWYVARVGDTVLL